VCVFGGGENTAMTQYILDLNQIDTGFDQMRGKAMPEAVWRNVWVLRKICG